MIEQTSITPFLMFQGRAEEAMRLYTSLFPNASITRLKHFEEGPNQGKVLEGAITLLGREYLFFDSPAAHAFTFTPSISLFVECESEEQINHLHEQLASDGSILMPLQAYDFAKYFVWLTDRFGVSWQLRVK